MIIFKFQESAAADPPTVTLSAPMRKIYTTSNGEAFFQGDDSHWTETVNTGSPGELGVFTKHDVDSTTFTRRLTYKVTFSSILAATSF